MLAYKVCLNLSDLAVIVGGCSIKYNIKGPYGHAFVFAEVNHNMKKGEYVYLILQFTMSGEIVKIIDNRKL